MQWFRGALLALLMIMMALISDYLGHQAYSWLPTPATVEAEAVGDLFSFLVTLGAMVFLAVMGVLTYTLIFYRAPKGDSTDAVPIRGNLKLEITWTVIPIILVMWIAGYSFVIYQRMNLIENMPIVQFDSPLEAAAIAQTLTPSSRPTPEEIAVEVKQWAWTFYYPSYEVISSTLHLPVNRRVHLKMRSQDVIHGFYVPNFRIKQDIVPNETIDFSFTPNRVGKYELHDSQFSGTYFALMEADVLVESVEEYEEWLDKTAKQQRTLAENKAHQEHGQPTQTKLRSRWHTVKPAEPNLVNPHQ